MQEERESKLLRIALFVTNVRIVPEAESVAALGNISALPTYPKVARVHPVPASIHPDGLSRAAAGQDATVSLW